MIKLTVIDEFAKNFVKSDNDKKKELIRRFDRISETGTFGSNDTERRNLSGGITEIKFKSGLRSYGGISPDGGFVLLVLGQKGDKRQQNEDIKKATNLYKKMTESKKFDTFSFDDIRDFNAKKYKAYKGR